MKVGCYQAKTHLPRLLERVAKGERITITRHGVPIAELVPVDGKDKSVRRRVIEELKVFGKGRRLGKTTIRQLIEEGRRY